MPTKEKNVRENMMTRTGRGDGTFVIWDEEVANDLTIVLHNVYHRQQNEFMMMLAVNVPDTVVQKILEPLVK